MNSLICIYNKFTLIRSRRVILLCSMAFILTACTEGTSDLEAWIDKVKSKPQRGIEPIPEIIPYKAFSYVKGAKRNPFDTSIFRPTVANTSGSGKKRISEIPAPNPNRVPEFLESFPLDTLRMVGTIAQDGQTWALVKTPDNTIQRVISGNYLGQNHGKIIDIKGDGIDLTEVIPDGFGGWQERAAAISISDQ